MGTDPTQIGCGGNTHKVGTVQAAGELTAVL